MTDKTVSSSASDEHVSNEERMRRHAAKQRAHMKAAKQRKKGRRVDPNQVKTAPDPSKPVTLVDSKSDRDVVLEEDGRLIIGLRIYTPNPDGSPLGRNASSKELLAKHREIRRERSDYIDLDGTHVRAGKVIRERKGRHVEEPTSLGYERDRLRRASTALKSIMVRLMPHEAEVAGQELKREQVERLMDEAVTGFQAATGCEIISAAVHRMSGHDLHIHIQYTMVVLQEKKVGKYSKEGKEWAKLASVAAREALLAKGVSKPNPMAIHVMKKRLVESGEIIPPPGPRQIFRKVKGLRLMGPGCILGYSFRHKLNLTRLAQEAGWMELGERVIDKKDEARGFRPIAARSDEDLEARYLDLWLERMWRRTVTSHLSEEAQEKIRSAGVSAAKDYADYGTVRPELEDIERRKVELEYEAAELEWDRQIQEMEEVKHADELEHAFAERLRAVAERVRELWRRLGQQRKSLREREERCRKLEADLKAREQKLESRERAVEESTAREKSREAEVETLRWRSGLAYLLAELLRQILEVPGVVELLRPFPNLCDRLREIAPITGLDAEVKRLEVTKDPEPKMTKPVDTKEGKAGPSITDD